jgi:hypothetical protein
MGTGVSLGVVAVVLVCVAVAALVVATLHLTGRREISDTTDTPEEVDTRRPADTPPSSTR